MIEQTNEQTRRIVDIEEPNFLTLDDLEATFETIDELEGITDAEHN